MEFVGGLLTTRKGYEYLFVVVDRFSKVCAMMPCKKTIGSQEATNFFFGQVWVHFGIPRSTVSNKDTIFIIAFSIVGEYGQKVEDIYNVPSANRWSDRSSQQDFSASSQGIQPKASKDLG